MSAFIQSPWMQLKDFERKPPLTEAEARRLESDSHASYANQISASSSRAMMSILKDQILLSPLIYFQAFCVLIWTITKYNVYTIVILTLAAVERFVAIRQTYKTWRHLHSIGSNADNQLVVVIRLTSPSLTESRMSVQAKTLVPGDHIIITPGLYIPCDCILTKGEVIADASFVTGESTAVRCIAAPPGKLIKSTSLASSVLLCGSQALRTRAPGGSIECRAVVTARGLDTVQGVFLMSVLNHESTPAESRLNTFLVQSVLALITLGSVIMLYTWIVSVSLNIHPTEIAVRVFDVLTDALPPALPLALAIASLAASFRLPDYISSARSGRPSHLLAGLVNKVVLDKTNTITTSDMTLTGVLESTNASITRKPSKGSTLELAIAACNYLAVLEEHVIVGDPLEVALLAAIGWELDTGDDSFVRRTKVSDGRSSVGPLSPGLEIASQGIVVESLNEVLHSERRITNSLQIVASYPFNPVTMRMSVVARSTESDKTFAFSKGAYEQVISKCVRDSVPFTLHDAYEKLSALGYRILAYSFKPIRDGDDELSREEVESKMIFCGLVLLSNELHPESRRAVKELRDCGIDVYLCTGDSAGTATAVARQCGITGGGVVGNRSTFHSPMTEPLLGSGWDSVLTSPSSLSDDAKRVMSRMTPNDKAEFVFELTNKSRSGAVLMCGDGPNDANALCAADVGVIVNARPNPLLESSSGCIACLDTSVGLHGVVEVVTHGRSALAVLFCVAKIVIAYAVIEGTCVALCYSLGDNLTDTQYATIDMLIILPSVLLLALASQPALELGDTSPLPPFRAITIGVCVQCGIAIGFQIAALGLLRMQDWYVPFQPSPQVLAGEHEWTHSTIGLAGVENTVLFLVCCFQCVVVIVLFTERSLAKWCRPMNESVVMLSWTRFLVALVAVMAVSCSWLRSEKLGKTVAGLFDLVHVDGVFMAQLVGLLSAQILVSHTWEYRVLPRLEEKSLESIQSRLR